MAAGQFVLYLPRILTAQAEQAPPAGGGWVLWFPLIIMVVFWYLLILRPQQAERAKRQEMLNALKKNDRVITTSGMIGTVALISQDGKEVTLKFGDSTRIPFLRTAIDSVIAAESSDSAS